MIEQPTLETTRLWIRPIESSDVTEIQRAASDRQIADTMISIPHPYPAGEAKRYVAMQQAALESECAAAFAIEHKMEGGICGLVEVRDIDREHSQGELSFWLAVEAWGHGYMSEAVQAVVRYAYETLDLNRLYAYHMLRNPASGRVLKRNGFKQEGVLRQRVRKWGKFEDVILLAVLRQEWLDAPRNGIGLDAD